MKENGAARIHQRKGGEGSLPLALIYIDIMHSDLMCLNPAMLAWFNLAERAARYTTTVRTWWSRKRRRGAMHPRHAHPCHPTTKQNWIFSRCFAIERQRRTYRRRLSTFAGNRSAFTVNRLSRSFRERRYFTGVERTEIKRYFNVSIRIAWWK